MNTVINVRIDKKTKSGAQKALAGLGLDLSSGIKLFLNQVITENGIPFVPTQNAKKIRARWDKEVAEALKNGKSYATAREMIDDIMK